MSLAPAHAAPPVVVRDLQKRFRGTTALAGVSFDVARGEVLGLLGPNGAGKTTTLQQQTRAGLARALLNEPELLILDEPTASLDPDIAEKTRAFLMMLRRERGLTILLYTSHNMAEVEEICDRIIFLHGGRVVAEGTPLEVSRDVLGAGLDAAAMHEVFIKISREGLG
jgi:ABC-type multidrug transport system ATPase subunit